MSNSNSHDISNRPRLGHASGNRWSRLERLMDAHEIVVHVVERNLMHVVLDLFREAIRQASETAHIHAHSEILALHVASADVLGIGIAKPDDVLAAHALRRTVRPLSSRIGTENLDELGIVDVIRK